MYVLEVREKGKVGRNSNNNFKSFEDFEFLMREKAEIEKDTENICLVYKISNNGKEVTRLTNKNDYVVVTDFDKEYRKGWKQYVSIRDMLVKTNNRDFYVDNDILYIKNGNDTIEVEMVRKTPRYEVRKNGKLVADNFTSQNDIIDRIFNKNKTRLLKSFDRKKDKFGYWCDEQGCMFKSEKNI